MAIPTATTGLAIIAANDRMAFGVLEALQQRGIQVPDAIAVTGFDDVSEPQAMGVPLTLKPEAIARSIDELE